MTPQQGSLALDPKAPKPIKGQHRKDAELEAWICEQLHVRDLFAGVTSTEIRRDRLKALLIERGLTGSIAGKRGGRDMTWSQLFERLYREPLL